MRKATLSALLLSLVVGCSIIKKEPYIETCYFDFGAPPPMTSGLPSLTVDAIKAQAPYRERMVFRKSANMLELDDYNRWSAPPEQLLSRRISLTFPKGGGAGGLKTDAEIIQLETDLSRKTTVVAVEFMIWKTDRESPLLRKLYRADAPTEETVTAEASARAAGVAVDRILEQLARDLTSIK